MNGFRDFTWDPKGFPHPGRLMRYLHSIHFHTVTIIDPGLKQDAHYAVYQHGLQRHAFLSNPDGTPFIGPVWPGNAAFPDFTSTAVRNWWEAEAGRFAAVGVDGLWNDMNEPSVFKTPIATTPDNVRFFNDGQPSTAREDHNVYGQQMSRASYAALLKLRPNRRPFVLTRATYGGGQRYAAVWTGDDLLASLP